MESCPTFRRIRIPHPLGLLQSVKIRQVHQRSLRWLAQLVRTSSLVAVAMEVVVPGRQMHPTRRPQVVQVAMTSTPAPPTYRIPLPCGIQPWLTRV